MTPARSMAHRSVTPGQKPQSHPQPDTAEFAFNLLADTLAPTPRPAPNPTELARRPLYREGLTTPDRHVLVCVDCSLVCDVAERECPRCSSERLQRVQR